MAYNKEKDIITGRIKIDDISDYEAMGYDNAPRIGEYHYMMKERPFSIGCQPKSGLIRYEENKTPNRNYYGIVVYDKELTEDQIRRYELTPLN